MNRSSEIRIADASVIARHHAHLLRFDVVVGATELAAPKRIAVDPADFWNPPDRYSRQAAAARQVTSLIERGNDPLFLEDTAGCRHNPIGRQVDSVLIIPADSLAVVDAA